MRPGVLLRGSAAAGRNTAPAAWFRHRRGRWHVASISTFRRARTPAERQNVYSTKNVTVRCYEVDSNTIQRAADRAGKSLSDYVRDILIPWAYSDLCEARPNMPPLERGRYTSMIDQAAKAAGLTRDQFEKQAAEQAAAQALGMAGPGDSGEFRRYASPGIPPRPMRKAQAQRNGAASGNSDR